VVHNPIYASCILNRNEIAVGDDKYIRIFNLQDWSYKKITKHNTRVTALSQLDETSFASGDTDGNVWIWSIDDETKE
jgi:WD40 repeat protein